MVSDYEKRTVGELLEGYAKLNNIPVNVRRIIGLYGETELHIQHTISPRRIEIIWSEVEDVHKLHEACKEAMDGWSKHGLSRFGQFEEPRPFYITTARGGGKNAFYEQWRRWIEMNLESKIDSDNLKGENNMEEFVKNLAKSDVTYLDIDGRRYPVEIDTINQEFGGPVKFIGHLARLDYDSYYPRTDLCAATPASTILKEIIDRRINQIKNRTLLPEIKRVHFSGPVTAVIWADGTKTLVRCTNEDIDYEKGLAMAIAKKAFGTNESGSNYYDLFKKFLPKDE